MSRASVIALAALLSTGCGREHPSAQGTAAPPPGAAAPATRPASAAGRDLAADERAGGHTLARHVGRTDDELRARLQRERGIAAASTWTDRETASRTVADTLHQAGRRLARWTQRAGPRPNLALDWHGGEPVGRSLERGEPAPEAVACAVVVLRWDTGRHDYYVLTSYPEVCR